MGCQTSLSSQTEKILKHKVTDVEESNVNLTDLYNECNRNEQSRKIVECLNFNLFILEDEDEDKQRMICFTPDSQQIHMFKNNNKKLKLTLPSTPSSSHASDCIHIPKTHSTIDKIIRTSLYRELLSFKKYLEINEMQLMLLNTSWRSKPYLSLALSQLLVGSILVNQNEMLLVNGIESYS